MKILMGLALVAFLAGCGASAGVKGKIEQPGHHHYDCKDKAYKHKACK